MKTRTIDARATVAKLREAANSDKAIIVKTLMDAADLIEMAYLDDEYDPVILRACISGFLRAYALGEAADHIEWEHLDSAYNYALENLPIMAAQVKTDCAE